MNEKESRFKLFGIFYLESLKCIHRNEQKGHNYFLLNYTITSKI